MRIRKFRDQLGLSRRLVVDQMGRSQQWLLMVETGRADPTYSDLVKLATRLNVAVEHLVRNEAQRRVIDDAAERMLDAEAEEDTKRRTFNRLAIVAVAGAATGMIDLDRIASDARRPIEVAALDDLALVTDSYARQWKVLPPGTLLPCVHTHLRLLMGIRASEQRRLHALTADTAVLAGYLAFQLEDRGRAISYWTLGRDLAAEIGGETWARALIALSAMHSQLAHGEGRPSIIAIDLLNGADRAAGPAGSRLLRAWAMARRAEEYAALGDGEAADRDLEAANTLLVGSETCSDAITGPRDSNQLDGFLGHSAVLLGRYSEAVGILRRSLDSLPIDMVAWRSVIHCDLAAALASLGEVDEACRILATAFSMATEVGATEHIQRVHGIRRRLDVFAGVQSVSRLDELIAL